MELSQHGWERIGLVLLGAGRSHRFGRNKLAEPLLSLPIRHTASIYAALPFARRVAVLGPSTPRLEDLGFIDLVLGDELSPQSGSLAAGIQRLGTGGLGSIMIALADMPFVTPAHLEALRRAHDGSNTVCSAIGPTRCPPAIFPRAAGAQLMAQGGDQGARAMLANAKVVVAEAEVLLDVDSVADLATAICVLNRPGDSKPDDTPHIAIGSSAS